MRFFNRMKEPVFLKEDSNADAQLERLLALQPSLNSAGQAIIQQDIRNLEYGIVGEKNIAFELRNSHIPMYILHDVYLEDGELSSQIDFLVFTRKLCFVIECKNLYGDIEVNSAGDFIRTMEYGGRKKKEGIYSPITQNKRHIELMRKLKVDNNTNALRKLIIDRNFDGLYRTLVVLANPKTVLNMRYAKKDIKDMVIRADQLIHYIKEANNEAKVAESSDREMLAWAESYLALHKEVEKDYTSRYAQYRLDAEGAQDIEPSFSDTVATETSMDKPMEDTALFEELRAYRLEVSRKEGVKPYFVYNNEQLKELISRKPRSKEELQLVKGFGKVKVEKYGDDILAILWQHK